MLLYGEELLKYPIYHQRSPKNNDIRGNITFLFQIRSISVGRGSFRVCNIVLSLCRSLDRYPGDEVSLSLSYEIHSVRGNVNRQEESGPTCTHSLPTGVES